MWSCQAIDLFRGDRWKAPAWIPSHCSPFFSIQKKFANYIFYNSQRWMSRLGKRWRTPQIAISAVNGRIPRIKRTLNAYCNFGLFPKLSLVQDVYTLMRLHALMHVFAFMCASVDFDPLAHEIRLTVESYALGEILFSRAANHSVHGNRWKLFVARMNLRKITRWI